jgi:hypothetical protein
MAEETLDVDDSVSQESKPNWRRDMEARAKAGDEAVAKLAQLERELSFRDAGVNPGTKQGQYFIKGYDGELTVDAIRAEAAELGLIGGGASQTPQPQIDYGAEQRIAQAADDAGPVASPELIDLIRRTSNEEELRALVEQHGITWNAAV